MTLATFSQPFGAYATPTLATHSSHVVMKTNFANLLNLIPDPVTGVAVTYAPDFDEIPPSTAKKLRAEISAVAACLAGAATSSLATNT